MSAFGADSPADSLPADSVADSVAVDTVIPDDSVVVDTAVDLETELPDRVVLSIDRLTVTTGQVYDTLDVSVQTFGYPIAGFDIKLAVNSRLIDVVDVLPGEVHDSCNWEFFDSRSMSEAGQPGNPAQLWQAVALAETVPGKDGPICFGFDRKASLLRLVVASSPSAMVDDTSIAVYFLWQDCGDNSLADRSGNVLLYSKQVHDYFPVADTETEGRFPTRLGAPKPCLDLSAYNPPVRLIELHNGGVEFRLDLGPERESEPTDTLFREDGESSSSHWDRIRKELVGMKESDQRLRMRIDSLTGVYGANDSRVQQAWRKQHGLDSTNLRRLNKIVDQYGWPGLGEVGAGSLRASMNLGPLSEYLQQFGIDNRQPED
jgi:hypothetical protein